MEHPCQQIKYYQILIHQFEGNVNIGQLLYTLNNRNTKVNNLKEQYYLKGILLTISSLSSRQKPRLNSELNWQHLLSAWQKVSNYHIIN